MSSDCKIETARANGAKSRGPATPEGRAKSSRNSLRHGLSAKTVLLPAESHEQFQLLLDAHIRQFQPASPVEMDLVEAMAVARWRLRRIWAIEASLLSNELTRRAEDIDDEFTEMNYRRSPGLGLSTDGQRRAEPRPAGPLRGQPQSRLRPRFQTVDRSEIPATKRTQARFSPSARSEQE